VHSGSDHPVLSIVAQLHSKISFSFVRFGAATSEHTNKFGATFDLRQDKVLFCNHFENIVFIYPIGVLVAEF
jgi:hypothetical protein